ncbi:Binding-protein-dependent transport systems inner membrane component OS=Tsukamurella paurometabola(strain ATCC 8368 / DSM / CCUG 35730 / CIP 100753 / JCM 10117 / KCTC 9821 / NBRC 16120 / NCIMB 702349 / NCTC 13040)OX=521096 GN=Tpau_2096 PE=3 SV=1 [Tsukamurella paurometabola]|uniref:Binding-protein-dependent transport systems inner membrane component n=1 Tax=Tsukamurella paurometabola (strain ATCC 8368 / DSM 20162 / CCUG 35730 / CIP 100753 / JCM 10117 / KCTC 9821 / NBRC 16120 / NCIMB 702349 / NCTC 13040) TaxID=521096 RepID=D5UPF2_TSUPD|nr:ABC transporter permease subunit [Tsukamurella paurometabola]ADG78708.1 binding-protein-dependent transport systems inner membrane component [Tsukamurella paurometabola DSM 20162]SUP32828.1 thiamine transporter membrane protein [Tsukamurella paurometabola]
MLIRNGAARIAVWLAFAVVLVALVITPIVVTLVTAFSATWTSVLPSALTFDHVRDAFAPENAASVGVSVQTAIIASTVAVVAGTWAALAVPGLPPRLRGLADAFFHLPVAVPSVVVGLGVLVAFSAPPLVLSGTAAIVILVQAILVFAFAYSMVSAAAVQVDPMLDKVGASLGASPLRLLVQIKLPLLAPAIAAAAGLSVALCMGELGATIMVYPASWRTLPVTVFTQSDRGDIFGAAANTLLLVLVTVMILGALSALRRHGRN